MRELEPSRSLRIAARTLRSERGVSLVVVIMLMVIILAITSAGMFFSSIELRAAGNYKAGTQAFYAADAGVGHGVALSGPNPIQFGPTLLAGGLTYCSGTVQATNRCKAPPQLSQLVATRSPPADYNIVQQTPQAGLIFCQYKMTVTGTGPLNSAREVEAQVLYGPSPTCQ